MSVWFDRFTKTWASTGVVTDPSDAQANAGFAFLGAAPPTVELFNALEQYSDKKDTYLYNQMASVFTWGGQTANETNPNTLRDAIISKQRQVLTAATNYYVDIAGNDSTGDGTIGNPWKTIQFAYSWVLNKIDPAGQSINIQMKSPGTYFSFAMNTPINGSISVIGDKLNPRNYIVKNIAGPAIYIGQGVVATIQGLSVEATATTGTFYVASGFGIASSRSSVVYIDAIAFGPCDDYQLWTGESGVIWPANGSSTSNIVYGSAKGLIGSSNAGVTQLSNTTLTFQGVPNYSVGFVVASTVGTAALVGLTISGSCTGAKYSINYNAVVGTNNAGATLPGSIAGSITTGGQLQ